MLRGSVRRSTASGSWGIRRSLQSGSMCSISPESMRSAPTSTRASVVFPAPDSPTTPTASPRRSTTSTSWSATMSPARDGKVRFTQRRASNASPGSAAGPGFGPDGTDARSCRVTGCCGSARSSAVVPVSTMRPPSITAIRSAIRATLSRSWLMSRRAVPRDVIARNSSRITAAVVGSRAVVGSSAMRRRGSPIRAEAMSARWRMPPESCPDRWLARWAGWGSPALSSACRTRARRVAPRIPRIVRDSPTSAAIVRSGSRDCNASCSTSDTSVPRNARQARGPAWRISALATENCEASTLQ